MKKTIVEVRHYLARLVLKLCRPTFQSLNEEFRRQRRREHEQVVAGLVAKTGSSRLLGKVAIVTGAATGIGRATAVLFAREGAKVVVADINEGAGQETVQEIVRSGGEAAFVCMDVCHDSDVERMVRTAVERYGKLNVLTNNAGILKYGTVENTPPEDWHRVIDTNLSSVYRCCRHAIPAMTKSGPGAITNIASVQGVAGFQNAAAYAASKGGIIALTRQIARDFAVNSIRVNCICPGVVLTPIFGSALDSPLNREAMLNEMADHSQLGTYGLPEDIAYAALYLASDESAFVTGAALVVDGGLTSQAH